LSDMSYCTGVFVPSVCFNLREDIFSEYMIVVKPLGGSSAVFRATLGIHPDEKVVSVIQAFGVPAIGDAVIFRPLSRESDIAFLNEHAPGDTVWPGTEFWLHPPNQTVQVVLANELMKVGGASVEVWVNDGAESQGVVTESVGLDFEPTSENAPAK
jgi:hypothetical protein